MSCPAQKQSEIASTSKSGSAAQLRGVERLRSRISDFARDTEGAVMMTFGLMAITMFALIGGAVDMGRWLNARDQTISAIDAAVLAAGRELQTGATAAQAKQVAVKYYQENTKTRLVLDQDNVDFVVSADKTTVTATGSARIRTPFMGLANVNHLQLFTGPEAPEATVLQRSHSGSNREISLMLDVSGSMCSPCTKRDDMKAAAADLITILLPETQGEFWTKIAVVPFSGDVRPPSYLYDNVTPPKGAAATAAWPDIRYIADGGGGGNGNGGGNSGNGNGNGNGNGGGNGNGNGNGGGNDDDDDDDDDEEEENPGVPHYRSACVAERQGPGKHTADPATPTSDFVTPIYVEKSSIAPAAYTAAVASSLCSTPVNGEVMPLSSDKTELLAKVSGLTTGGGTAGHVGTAWAYYMLSPDWYSASWVSGANLPDGSIPVDYGTPKTKKIAILMTDGEYNREVDKDGLVIDDQHAGQSANGNSSSAQALATCNQMKHDGIEVYTIGFDLGGNQNAINLMKNCASSNANAYTPENGAALKLVFRDIAIKLTDLHLSK